MRSLFENAPPYDDDGRDGCTQVRPLFALLFFLLLIDCGKK
jgi:hypothetical protein